MNKKFKIYKSIFQIKYKPDLAFYDKLFKAKKIFSHFEDWETNGLGISLKNYEHSYSLTIKHDSIHYISDKYKKKFDDSIFELVSDNLENFIDIKNVNHIGYRIMCLRSVDFSIQELIDILNLKLLSEEIYKKFDDSSSGLRVTFVGNRDKLRYRLLKTPVTKEQIPHFFKAQEKNYNTQDVKMYEKLSKYYNSLPNTSLLLDIDVSQSFSEEIFQIKNIKEFNKSCYDLSSELTNHLENYIFGEKLF